MSDDLKCATQTVGLGSVVRRLSIHSFIPLSLQSSIQLSVHPSIYLLGYRLIPYIHQPSIHLAEPEWRLELAETEMVLAFLELQN